MTPDSSPPAALKMNPLRFQALGVFLVRGRESDAAGKIHGKRRNLQDEENSNNLRAPRNNQLS